MARATTGIGFGNWRRGLQAGRRLGSESEGATSPSACACLYC
ncbi:unnamed protein product [Amoebophrya sp. A120]|nr:unnamed protein product [Amoebophrya sp. A120]